MTALALAESIAAMRLAVRLMTAAVARLEAP